MHYIFLKNILQTILENFSCPQCQSKTTEQAMLVTGISSHAVDVHINCHICSMHSHLCAEVNSIATQMLDNEHGKKFFEEFIKNGGTIGANMEKKVPNQENTPGIKDEDIIKIHNDLKNIKSVEDLMSE